MPPIEIRCFRSPTLWYLCSKVFDRDVLFARNEVLRDEDVHALSEFESFQVLNAGDLVLPEMYQELHEYTALLDDIDEAEIDALCDFPTDCGQFKACAYDCSAP